MLDALNRLHVDNSMGMTTLLHHGAQVLVTLYALEQMYGEIAHHMDTSDMSTVSCVWTETTTHRTANADTEWCARLLCLLFQFFDLMFEEDFIREFKQPHQTNAKVMTYYASILVSCSGGGSNFVKNVLVLIWLLLLLLLLSLLLSQLITAAFETPLYLGRMYGKLLKFFPPLGAEEKQSWFTNDEIVAFFNYFYWVMLKLIGVPFATIYLLAYYGKYSADIGGTIAVIVISATILIACDIKVAMTFLKHYRYLFRSSVLFSSSRLLTTTFVCWNGETTVDSRAAARLGRRSTVGDKEEVASTTADSDNESFDVVTERFRGSIDLRNMSSSVRQIVQEEYKDEKLWRKCKFRIFKTLAYSAMAIISLAFEFHLLNFSHDKQDDA